MTNKQKNLSEDLEKYLQFQKLFLDYSYEFHLDGEKNPRALVIIGGAFLDTLLTHILENYFVSDSKEVNEILDYTKPSGSYGNKARMAYCLGLICKPVYQDLKLIGKIRNRFAHNLYASFEDDSIQSLCAKLEWHKISYAQPPSDASSQDLFYVAVLQVVTYLSGAISTARVEKRSVPPYI